MNSLVALLEKYQATTHVVAINLHNLHWNLEDHLFFTLHPYLGDLYEQINDFEDEIAEQIRFFGERPLTSLSDINHLSAVEDMASKAFSGQEAIKSALEDIEALHKVATEVVKEADTTDIWSAVEKFSGHLVTLEKIIYFLRSSKI